MALGAIALFPALAVLGVLIAMWRAWWLHPLWALLLVPLGVPAIGYWQFLALGMFMHSWLAWKTGDTSDDEKDLSKRAAVAIVVLLWPIITYYLVRWYLS